ncbi:CHAT domain-containing protein [Actinacidiphila glaucinigra]|uniref:CHAT domain-containing protein n=1 Tax=Actinacidiphila glaucinigra TaxID=235986 RepID=UPI0037C9B32D
MNALPPRLPGSRDPRALARRLQTTAHQTVARAVRHPTVMMATARMSATSRLPEGIAVLHISAERTQGEDSYRVRGWCWCGRHRPLNLPPSHDRLLAPDITLAGLRPGGEDPSEILRGIRRWSARHPELLDWLAHLRDDSHEPPAVLVRDETGGDFPWEMLWVRQGTEPELLGAVLSVSRWIVRGSDDLPRNRLARPGRVVAYVDREMEGDLAAFVPFEHDVSDTLPDFLDTLEEDEHHTDLVYLGCHGHHGSRLSELRLDNLTWQEIEERSLNLLESHRPVVFLNVCHSGQFLDARRQGERRRRGFAELFLAKGADGCIVAAGEVGDPEARTLVHILMAGTAGLPGHALGELIRAFRQHRAQALGDLSRLPLRYPRGTTYDLEGQRRVRDVLYAFMFHYYGHPARVLALAEPPGKATA